MLTRRALLAGAAAQPALRSQKKPNFLFLISDDHAGYVLGCDGNRQAETPNLDKLASEGTRFSRHFCNSPVCTPSRQSFLTGMLPHAAGVTVLRTALSESKPTLAKQLKKAGYSTAVFGKMHFNKAAREGMHGFDVMMTEGELTRSWASVPHRPMPEGSRTKKMPWAPFKDPARLWLNADNLPYPRFDDNMRSAYLVRQASSYLEAHKDKPFALWVSFQEPHSPFDFPYGDSKMKSSAGVKPPPVGPEDAWQIPLIFRDLSDEERTGIISAYYNSVRYLDRNIGRVLTKLSELGLEENTLVVYMADHGYSLGQHGRFEKHCCYDPALRVPLIFRWPGRIRKGVIRDMTESVDVPHTVLDLLDAPPLPLLHGTSLRGYLEGRRPSQPREYIVSEYLENEEACVRTETRKFVFCSGNRARTDGYATDNPTPGRHVRLFDLKKDPDEFTDIAKREPDTITRLQGVLLERFRSTHPETAQEPQRLSQAEAIEWYLRPRDAAPGAGA